MPDAPDVGLLAATALHAGFQLTVTTLVYPALARVDESGWRTAHDRHRRAVTPLVGVVYAALVAAAAWAVLGRGWTPALGTAVVGVAVSLLCTAAVAAPLHGRLAREGPGGDLLRRLRRADLVRTGGALLALLGAAVLCLGG